MSSDAHTCCCTTAATKPCAKESADAKKKTQIIAARFKTEMCRSFEKTGRCPYVSRCMFAHGRRELRTEEQNLRDGLTSEEAVKEWKEKRAKAIATKKEKVQKKSPQPAIKTETVPAEAEVVATAEPASLPTSRSSSTTSRSATPSLNGSVASVSSAGATLHESPSTPVAAVLRTWRHDPYRAVTMITIEPYRTSPLAMAFHARQ